MLKDKIDVITEELGQTFEEAQNSLVYQSQKQLERYIKDPNWMVKQYAANGKFKINLLQLAKKELRTINQTYERAFRTGLKKANQPINEEAIKRLLIIKQQNAEMMAALANQVYQAHKKFIARINLAPGQTQEIAPLDRTNAIYNQICKVMSSKEAQDEYKAVYKDGKKFTFKSYMEMNARTTMMQELAQQQMEAAVNNGDVFFLCNCFEDCRPSHISYQGKVYFDERYREMGFDEKTINKIEEAIASRGMVSRQSVEDQEPYLGNTPNCRHEFASVPIEDVISMTDTQLLKENNMLVAKATTEKYKLSQQQRAYERKIRAYKFNIEQSKQLIANAPKGADTSDITAKLEHDKEMLKKYYGNIRTLIKEHPSMERDYNRESVRIIREDLGARRNNNIQESLTPDRTKKALDELTEISRRKSNR